MSTATTYSGTPAYSTGVAGSALSSGALLGAFPASAGSWTIEGWIRYPAKGLQAVAFGWGAASSWVGVNGGGYLSGSFGATGYPVSPGTWHHLAVTGDGNVVQLFLDGVWAGEVAGAPSDASIAALYIGSNGQGLTPWSGGIDEVRVSQGMRYAAYRDFTAPSAPLAVDSTTLALWHLDGNGADAVSASTGSTGSTGTTTPPATGGGTTTPPVTGGGTTTGGTKTYSASSAVFSNPDQGWFQYTETHYYSDGSGHTPLVAADLVNARTGSVQVNGVSFTARSLVFRYFYIEKFKTVATIDAAYLTKLAADLATIRQAGCKAVIRFSYYNQQSSDSDATPALVLGHIDQLAPTLNQYADVLHAVEAGFIGAWGEWYYTYNFGDQGSLNAQNVADRNAVVRRLLDRLDSSVFVLLRYLGSRQTFLNSSAADPGGADSPRLGHHNDAFLADDGNWGTYNSFTSLSVQQNRDYLAAMPPVPVGGESGRWNPPMTEWPNASTELAAYHFSFLNPNYYGQTINVWGQTNCDTAARSLGHRLRLVSATVPSTVVPRAGGSVSVTLRNDGWQAPLRNRPTYLLLDDGAGHTARTAIPVDLRTIKPGKEVTVAVPFTAPDTAGTYSVSLWMPDPNTALASRPEYAIRLANDGVWSTSTGRNDLGSPLTVSATSGGTTPTQPTNPTGSSGTLRNIVRLNVNGTVRAVKLVR